MPRKYKRTSLRGSYGNIALKVALKAILFRKKSVKSTSKMYGIPCRTLRRHRDGKVSEPGKITFGRFYSILSAKYEKMFASYLLQVVINKTNQYLTSFTVRKLVYEFLEKNNIENCFNKNKNNLKIAGKDWYRGFVKRNPQILTIISRKTRKINKNV